MKNMKIGKKFLVVFGIILLVLVSTVIVSIYGLVSTGGQYTSFYEYSYPISMKSLEVRRNMQEALKWLSATMLTEDQEETQSYIEKTSTYIQAVHDDLDYLLEHYTGDTAPIVNCQETLDQLGEIRKEIEAHTSVNENAEATDIYLNRYLPTAATFQSEMTALDNATTELADNDYNTSHDMQIAIEIVLIALSVAAIGVTIFMALYLTKSLVTPITEIETAANRMANGDFDISLTYESLDELGTLSDSMRSLTKTTHSIIDDAATLLESMASGDFLVNSNMRERYVGIFSRLLLAMRTMRDKLTDVLTQINEAAEQVADGSDQVSAGAQTLSQGSTEQASSVEQLAASITAVSDQITATTKNTEDALKQTNKASEMVNISNTQMQEMIGAMGEISQKSTEIGKIIKTIEDIAFQTNILALNAAVEAARAGTAGKGFAVVADEVRNLASKSAEASKNTATLIEGTVEAVGRGTGIANSTAESLLAVVDSTQAVVDEVNKITRASEAQATAVGQISQGIDQISMVVQSNSATAEESAAASEELSGQAAMLKGLVAQFKLRAAGAAEALTAPIIED